MSYCEDEPRCPPDCTCGCWSPCPWYPYWHFKAFWWELGRRIQYEREERERIASTPTRWQRFKAVFRSPVPRARVL